MPMEDIWKQSFDHRKWKPSLSDVEWRSNQASFEPGVQEIMLTRLSHEIDWNNGGIVIDGISSYWERSNPWFGNHLRYNYDEEPARSSKAAKCYIESKRDINLYNQHEHHSTVNKHNARNEDDPLDLRVHRSHHVMGTFPDLGTIKRCAAQFECTCHQPNNSSSLSDISNVLNLSWSRRFAGDGPTEHSSEVIDTEINPQNHRINERPIVPMNLKTNPLYFTVDQSLQHSNQANSNSSNEHHLESDGLLFGQRDKNIFPLTCHEPDQVHSVPKPESKINEIPKIQEESSLLSSPVDMYQDNVAEESLGGDDSLRRFFGNLEECKVQGRCHGVLNRRLKNVENLTPDENFFKDLDGVEEWDKSELIPAPEQINFNDIKRIKKGMKNGQLYNMSFDIIKKIFTDFTLTSASTPGKMQRFKCPLCPKSLGGRRDVQAHIESDHTMSLTTCLHCKALLTSQKSCAKHRCDNKMPTSTRKSRARIVKPSKNV